MLHHIFREYLYHLTAEARHDHVISFSLCFVELLKPCVREPLKNLHVCSGIIVSVVCGFAQMDKNSRVIW